MKKITLTLFLVIGLFLVNDLAAQKYKSAVGVRFTYGLTGSYKQFINETNAFELYLGTAWGNGLYGGAQYQIHKPLEFLGIENLDWYYGGGAYVGTWNGWGFGSDYLYIGINANIGLDYTFSEYPINISTDWSPGFTIVGSDLWGRNFNAAAGGLAVRYILGSD